MFTENDIDKLIWQIILKQLTFNADTIAKIIVEMTHIESLDYNVVYNYVVNSNALNEAKRRIIDSVMNDISALIFLVGEKTYLDTKNLYDYRKINFPKFRENENIYKRINYISSRVRAEYSSIMNNKLGLVVNNNGIMLPRPLSVATNELMNKARESVTLGTNFDIERHINNLSDNGLRFIKQSHGIVTSYATDSYLESILNNASRDAQNEVLTEVATQVHAVGVELSAHVMPAPDHAPVQGRQFSQKEFEKMQNAEPFFDVQGHAYAGFERPIGAWNCRHITYPIIIGISKQRHSDKQLAKILKENEAGYTMSNGKHYTLYECTQYQRRLEREVRRYKTALKSAQAINNKELIHKYATKIAEKTNDYKLFSQEAGIPQQIERLSIE